MKRAIKINLGGLIFHIDEDAYDKLQIYLDSLSRQFGDNSEAKEIISDIESRIAELFQAKVTAVKQVINFNDVVDVIAIMGKPSDYGTENSEHHYQKETNKNPNNRRRFYRDVDNAAIGGVCSGIGAYFNFDPVIIRIIFVLLFFVGGATLLIYLILWIALPAARTSAQKLEMRGEDVNINNIERTIKQDNDQTKQKHEGKFRNILDEIFHALGTVVKAVVKVVGIFAGFILTIIGLALILAFFFAFSFGDHWTFNNHLHILHMPFLAGQFINPFWFTIMMISLILIACIPVLCIIFLGLKLIFKFNFGNRILWLSLFIVWIVCIMFFTLSLVSGFKNINEEHTKSSSLLLNFKPYKTLIIKMNPSDSITLRELIKINGEALYYISEDKKIYGRPHLIIEKDFNDEAVVKIEKSARGLNLEDAIENTLNISFDVVQKDSIVLFNPYFEVTKNTNWRAQQVELRIKLPKGLTIFIDKSIEPLIIDAETKDNLSTSELSGKTWIMGEQGLRRAN